MIKSTSNIVEIEEVKKIKQQYLVKSNIDELYCNEELIVECRIFKNKKYSLSEWNKIHSLNNYYDCLNKTIKFCSYKLRTKEEVINYIKKDNQYFDKIINKLIKMHLIDDERYLKLYLESKMNLLYGPIYIKYHLLNKGLPEELVNKELLIYKEEKEIANIKKLIYQYKDQFIKFPKVLQQQKLKGKLIRLGYHSHLIDEVLNNTLFNEDYLDNLQKEIDKMMQNKPNILKIKAKLLKKGYKMEDINDILKKY